MRHHISFFPLASCLLLLLAATSCVDAASILPTSWPQQGGSAANLGIGWNSTYSSRGGGNLTSLYASHFDNAQCQTSFVYLAPANSFFFLCWNNDELGNMNVTLWQVDAASGVVQFGQSLTAYPQTLALPQLTAPAIYSPKPDSAEGSIVFVQTNAELRAFRIGSSGTVESSSSVPMVSVVQCGTSITVSQGAGLTFVVSDSNVTAWHAESFFAEDRAATGKMAWSYSYPDPQSDYLLSTVAEDAQASLLTFTYARGSFGVDVVCLSRTDGSLRWRSFFSFPDDDAVAGAPLLYRGRVYVGLYPQGLTVLDLASGRVVSNGSYAIATSSGLSPNLFVDAAGEERILYEAATNDGISSQYQMLVADLDGTILPHQWPTALVLACDGGSQSPNFRQISQGIVAAGGARGLSEASAAPVYVAGVTSQYSSISCVCGFDLHSGSQLFRYQAAPIGQGLVWASPLVDAQGVVYALTTNQDLTSTLSALHTANSTHSKKHTHMHIAEW